MASVQPPKPADVAKRMEFLLQEHGFAVVAYFGYEGSIRFILVSADREGYDLLLQVPQMMKLDSVKAHSSCQIELQRADNEWLKHAGEQADIDVKYMSRNMRQLLENIEENVKVHNRIVRLKLSWFDPTRKLLFVESPHQASAPRRFAVSDMARCPEWIATRPTIWFSAPLDQLFTQNFSLWEESVLTGQWLRSTMWHDQKRLWVAMNANWKALLGDRLVRANDPHPFTYQFQTQCERIVTVQDEMVRLRKLSFRDNEDGDRAREMLARGGALLLKLQRNVISALLAYGDVAEEWHTFFPAFEYSMKATKNYLMDDPSGSNEGKAVTSKASQAFDSVFKWLSPEEEAERDRQLGVEDDQPNTPLFSRERPLSHRLAKLHIEDSDEEPKSRPAPQSPVSDDEEDLEDVNERTKIGLGMVQRHSSLTAPSVSSSNVSPDHPKSLAANVHIRSVRPLEPIQRTMVSSLEPIQRTMVSSVQRKPASHFDQEAAILQAQMSSDEDDNVGEE